MAHRVAVVDIGSNTLKYSVTEVDANGAERIVASMADTVRLGYGVALTGAIEPRRIEMAMAALRRYEQHARSLGAQAMLGVATAALRMATNGGTLLDRIATETSWTVRVISGDEEARLAFEGLRGNLPATGLCVIADVGGASTEVIRVEDGSVAAARSIDIGSGTLADRCFRDDPPGSDAMLEAAGIAHATLRGVDVLDSAMGAALYLSGGNGQFLSGIAMWERVRLPFVPGFLHLLVERLADIPAWEVAAHLGIAEERARMLPAGGAIALSLARLIEPMSLHAVPSGIRGGLVREWVDSGFPRGDTVPTEG